MTKPQRRMTQLVLRQEEEEGGGGGFPEEKRLTAKQGEIIMVPKSLEEGGPLQPLEV